jgi:putative phage-type endonuclease
MATIIRPKERAEWLKLREEGIGSSEVATIIGINPYETPFQLWRRKLGIDPPKTENFAMRAGHYLEDAVARFWMDETGQEVIKSSAGDWLIVDDDKPYLRVSPDRTYWLKDMPKNNKNKGILECKTTQKSIDSDDIPKHWFVQVQYQLGVAGLEEGALAWLSAGREFGYKPLAFVKDFYDYLCEEVTRFWVDNIQNRIEPSAVNAQDVMLKYNKHTDGKTLEVGSDVFNNYLKLKSVKERIAELDIEKAQLEDSIKSVFEDAEAISYGGDTIATWKAPKPSKKFDTKAFQAMHPELAQEFTISVQGARRFLLK